jgi:hypothetical protein
LRWKMLTKHQTRSGRSSSRRVSAMRAERRSIAAPSSTCARSTSGKGRGSGSSR